MSKQDDRGQKITEWLKHLQGWKDSDLSVAAYAKGQGLALWAMYHWRGVLIREGRWHEERKPTASTRSRSSSSVPTRFAKVSVAQLCPPVPVTVTVRLHLSNGRCAEIDLRDVEQFDVLLAALERQP